jgi:N-acetyl-anhydromuramyl-L-alanine amidase AmpD
MSDEDWRAFSGVLGHYHIQQNKVDPGPAFDWERFLAAARKAR